MTRLLVHVEDQTEEQFVNELLAPHLYEYGFSRIGARLVGNARQRERRGGIKAWSTVCKEITNHLKADTGCLATTMVDYYGMPVTGPRAWPGRLEASRQGSSSKKAKTVEDALSKDIALKMGSDFDRKRFIPYVAMHEFEALLFSDCDRFGQEIGRPDLSQKFQEIRNQFASPEEIDDSPDTAPSARVAELVPGYQKPRMGSLAALQVGLYSMRSACPNFRRWVETLERLPARMGA